MQQLIQLCPIFQGDLVCMNKYKMASTKRVAWSNFQPGSDDDEILLLVCLLIARLRDLISDEY